MPMKNIHLVVRHPINDTLTYNGEEKEKLPEIVTLYKLFLFIKGQLQYR